MDQQTPFHISIPEILKEKAPNKKYPKFVIKLIQKIACEDDLNDFFRSYPGAYNIEFMVAAFKFLDIQLTVEGQENLPKEGRFIFASNHPLGGLDGVALGAILGQTYGENVRYIANEILMNLKPLSGILVPVNKLGGQQKNMAESMHKLFASDNHLIMFPAGMCSRKVNGEIKDLEWKKSFVAKAVEYQRDIVPIYFEGKNSKFFYNLANIRKKLGIKFNIEMMLLSHEMFSQRGNHFIIRIGQPIPWQTFDKSKTAVQWAQWVKEISYSMRK